MTLKELNLYTTAEAAEFLGVSVSTVKYHLYEIEDLEPDAKVGGRLVFTEETLRHFQEHVKRPPGRPAKNADADRFPSPEQGEEERSP